MHSIFLAPELSFVVGGTGGNTELDDNEVSRENVGCADIWSLGKLALFLLRGLPERDIEELHELELDPCWLEFLNKSLDKDPSKRYRAKNLIKSKLFKTQQRFATKNSHKITFKTDISAQKNKAFFQASILEQVIIGFLNSS